MTFQIKQVVLYGAEGRQRLLTFRLGEVNIVTGESGTGKSALIDIIDYCLGRDTCPVATGFIRDKVLWFAALFETTSVQVFVARPRPDLGRRSSTLAYFNVGPNLIIPPLSSLQPNTDTTTLIERLSQIAGIEPNIHRTPEGQTRRDLEATIAHASFFLFQGQDEIARRQTLFHRQTEPFIGQAIKDVLPFFLGAYQQGRLRLEQQLRQAMRRLSLAERRVAEAAALRSEGTSAAVDLLLEARQAGLLADGPVPSDPADVATLLSPINDWTPEQPSFPNADQLVSLQRDRERLYEDFAAKSEEIATASSLAGNANQYSTELSHQVVRLESIYAFGDLDIDQAHCPICSSQLDTPLPNTRQIQETLSTLRLQLGDVAHDLPRVNELVERLETELADIRNRIDRTDSGIRALLSEQEAARRLQDRNSRQARVSGRISFYLQHSTSPDESELEREATAAQAEVDALRAELADDLVSQRLVTPLSRLSALMTEWSDRLALEHSGNPVYFDLSHLTLAVDFGTRIIRLTEMGSGENWVAYHLIAHLALHHWFAQNNSPVPRFLMLDQPTQVYFPSDRESAMHGSEDRLNDEDRLAVNRMFQLIFDIVEGLGGALQVIISDHADLNNEQFSGAIVERWRAGQALVPYDWPDAGY